MSFSHRTVYSSSVRSSGIGTPWTTGATSGATSGATLGATLEGVSPRRFAPLGSSASVYGGAGGAGSRISRSFGLGLGVSGIGSGVSGLSLGVSGLSLGGSAGNEKEAMQELNERLAAYLEQVRSLERENRHLETQIREVLAQKGPQSHDWTQQWEVIEELRDKILEAALANARALLQIDNARLAAEDFRVKFEAELASRLSVDNDVTELRKVLDDTNMTRLQLEGEIEALREELILMRKNHEQELQDLQGSGSALTVEVDAPQSQDLGKVLEELRAQYDALAQKNLEELEKQWGQQISESSQEVTRSTQDLDRARGTARTLRRSLQGLQLELESLRQQISALEAALADAQARAGAHLAQVQAQVGTAEAELRELRAQLRAQHEQHRELEGAKERLEREIETYRGLLEGEGLSLRDALDTESTAGTAAGTGTGTTHRVVTETREVKVRTY